MRRLALVVFQLWALGAFGLAVLAVCRFVFAPKLVPLLSRLQLALIWPIALMSRGGRRSMFETYKLKNGE